ncbi:hypothetical protein N7471_005801 [Penicillium samsonianum]|uniref:uncharacterized protein n=1 Tax=Penicillium samsonianum TaxID=1882272 RepID=UPI0025469376|nr:uncharacterized protein N7471_005801 [Penicillium samsonianum]KAJ6139315.1 hypothetical protein N7471_005801 [Penicillium samsonianum]
MTQNPGYPRRRVPDYRGSSSFPLPFYPTQKPRPSRRVTLRGQLDIPQISPTCSRARKARAKLPTPSRGAARASHRFLENGSSFTDVEATRQRQQWRRAIIQFDLVSRSLTAEKFFVADKAGVHGRIEHNIEQVLDSLFEAQALDICWPPLSRLS